jgi:hypothetical protein
MRFVDQHDDEGFKDPERDIPNRRVVFLGNGREIKLERRDPFGFVYIIWDSGSTPIALQGSYTDFDQARRALEIYINNNTFEDVSDEPTKKVEPIKYKKVYRTKSEESLPA